MTELVTKARRASRECLRAVQSDIYLADEQSYAARSDLSAHTAVWDPTAIARPCCHTILSVFYAHPQPLGLLSEDRNDRRVVASGQ